MAWGLYKFAGLNDVTPQWLNIECLPDMFGQEYFVAVADYTLGDWRWFGPVTFPEFQLDMSDLNHHVISALGNMYFIVVCRAGNGAVISKSTLTVEEGGGEDPGWLPGAPHHLVATDGVFDDKVVIEWEPGVGADYYKLWRKAPEGEWGKYAEVEGMRYEDTDVETGVHYVYKAFSVNGSGSSEHSNIDEGWAGESGGEPRPGTPYDFHATDGEFEDHVLLTWEYVGEYDVFEIWRKAPEGDWESYTETTDFLFEDFDVVPGVHYAYKAWAWLNGERGDHSNIDEGWAGEEGGEGVPPAYDLVATDGEFEDHVLVTWGYEHEGAGFDVYRRLESGGDWEVIGETLEYSYEDFTAEPGVHYKYKVVAWLDGEPSEPSDYDVGWASESGGEGTPPAFNLVASDGEFEGYVLVTWDYEFEGAGFDVYRRQEGEGFEWDVIGETLSHAYEDDTAALGVHYIYKVVAWLDGEPSEPSNQDVGWAAEGGEPGTGSISILVENGEGDPLSGIGVVLYGNEALEDTSTGEDGWAVFDGLEYGIFLVVPVAADRVFEPAYVLVGLSAEQPDADLTFTASLSSAPLHRLRGVAYTFTGDPVEGSRWQPLANVRMRITLIGLEEHWDVYTDENGYYEQLDLPAGSYTIIPLLEGYTFSPELHDPVINGENAPGLQNFRGYPAG